MQKHVGIFTLWYLGFSTVAVLLAYFLDFGGTSTGAAALVASSLMAGSAFGKEHNRVPSPEEKSAFAWGALAVSGVVMLVSVLAVLVVGLSGAEARTLMKTASSPTFTGIMVATVFVLGVVYFWLARWSFGWFAGKQIS